MFSRRTFSLYLALALAGGPCLAQPALAPQSLDALSRAAHDYLKPRVAEAYPELQARIDIRPPDPRLQLTQCEELEFTLPSGASLNGIGSIGIRCASPRAWALYLAYQVGLRGPAVRAARPLAPRAAIKARDVQLKDTDLTGDPGRYLRDPRQAVGLLTKRPIQADQAITLDMLDRPLAIRSGQKVRIAVQTPSFTVSQECTAMSNAMVGDLVRCKAGNGRILQGIATEAGTLEIAP